MILEAIGGTILGIAGVIPFVHTNFILQAISPIVLNPISKAVLAISISASHSLFEILSTLAIITGFGFGRDGKADFGEKGFLGIYFIAFKAIVCCILLLPIAYFALPLLKNSMGESFRVIFLSIIVAQFISEKNLKKAAIGIGVFLLAGILGSITFYRNIVIEPLFPMLSGFFAIPALLLGEEKMQKEYSDNDYLGENNTDKSLASPSILGSINANQLILLAVFLSAISTLFPALTVGTLLGIGLLILRDQKLIPVIVPALIVSKVFFDITASAITGNTRSYAAVLAAPLGEYFGGMTLPLIACIALFSSCLSLAFILQFKGKIINIYQSMERGNSRIAFLIGIICLIAIIGGVGALILAITAACLGIAANQLKTKRSYLMGALMVSSICYLFEISIF